MVGRWLQVIVMAELACFTLALALPYDPQMQLMVSIVVESAVVLVLLTCLPLLSVFKNVIYIVARVVDISLLSYLYVYDPCTEME